MTTSPLKKLECHLKNLNADTATMIQTYLNQTGIKVGIISDIIKLRDTLETESNPELYQKYEFLKKDVIDYVHHKIKTKTDHDHDHDHDLWFEILEIAKHSFTELRETAIRDIEASSWEESMKNDLIKALKEERYTDVFKIRYGA